MMKKCLLFLCILAIMMPWASLAESTTAAKPAIELAEWLAYYEQRAIYPIFIDAAYLKDNQEKLDDQYVMTVLSVRSVHSRSVKADIPDGEAGFFVDFELHFNNRSDIANYEKGQWITVVGRCKKPSLLGKKVHIQDCQVLAKDEDARSLHEDLINRRGQSLADIYLAEEIRRVGEMEAQQVMLNSKVVDYMDVARNPEKYNGTLVKVSGVVAEVKEPLGNISFLRISDGGNIWHALFMREEGQSKVLLKDRVTIYGVCSGQTPDLFKLYLKEYLPFVTVSIIEMHEY